MKNVNGMPWEELHRVIDEGKRKSNTHTDRKPINEGKETSMVKPWRIVRYFMRKCEINYIYNVPKTSPSLLLLR